MRVVLMMSMVALAGAGCRMNAGCVDKERRVDVDESVFGVTAADMLAGVPTSATVALFDGDDVEHTLDLSVTPDPDRVFQVTSEFKDGMTRPLIDFHCADRIKVEAQVRGEVTGGSDGWTGSFEGAGRLRFTVLDDGSVGTGVLDLQPDDSTIDPAPPEGVIVHGDGVSIERHAVLVYAYADGEGAWSATSVDAAADMVGSSGDLQQVAAWLATPPEYEE